MRVALFVTCFNDTLFPGTGRAVVELLERLGHEVEFPEAQTCCGQMHGNTGYEELGDGLVLGVAAYEEARQVLVDECEASGSITIARFRDRLGIGRRAAQILLERFDADGVTRRVGDERVLRRRPRSPGVSTI